MSESTQTSYDEIPYASYPYPQSHPDRLATIATLFGLKAPTVERCRVLELGCAAGGNLIPMADALPESTFVGVDLSEIQVAEGQQIVATLGLANISLRRLSITDIGPDFGEFDYILCHGVYSWVPPAAQDHILSVCKRNLAADGVAYVSYNTMPGWHMRGTIRDMMYFHSQKFTTPAERAKQARQLLSFLVKSLGGTNNPYGTFLKSELELLQDKSDSYLIHEHLEKHNDPCYFHQFMQRATAKGLRYLGESDLSVMVPGNFPSEVAGVLRELSPEMLHLEQYMDFLRNRTFRQTLLCHADREPSYDIKAEKLTEFHVASPVRAASAQPDLGSTQYEQFQSPAGVNISSREPIVKAALLVLSETWPQSVPFVKLRSLVRARLQPGPIQDAAMITQDTQQLGQTFLQCYASASNNLIELFTRPMRLTARPGEQPRTRPLARWQAKVGNYVTNLRHEPVPLGAFERQVVQRLDGAHDRAAILKVLGELVQKKELTVQFEGEVVQDQKQIESMLGEALEQQLGRLAKQSLVVE